MNKDNLESDDQQESKNKMRSKIVNIKVGVIFCKYLEKHLIKG